MTTIRTRDKKDNPVLVHGSGPGPGSASSWLAQLNEEFDVFERDIPSLLDLAASAYAPVFAKRKWYQGISFNREWESDPDRSETVSNALVQALVRTGNLNAETLKRLTPDLFTITNGDISGCAIDTASLGVFLGHPLENLNLSGCHGVDGDPRTHTTASIEAYPSVKRLDLVGFERTHKDFDLVEMVDAFPNLEVLFLESNQNLNNVDLEWIAEIHPQLRVLNISNCQQITDISGLKTLSSLEAIWLDDLRLMEIASTVDTLRCLKGLQMLQMGLPRGVLTADYAAIFKTLLAQTKRAAVWPHLMELDIAGVQAPTGSRVDFIAMIKRLVKRLPKLKAINLMETPAHSADLISFCPSVDVLNMANPTNAVRAWTAYTTEGIPWTEWMLRAVTEGMERMLKQRYNDFTSNELSEIAESCYLALLRVNTRETATFVINLVTTLTRRDRVFRIDHIVVASLVDQCFRLLRQHAALCIAIWHFVDNDLMTIPVEFDRLCSLALSCASVSRDRELFSSIVHGLLTNRILEPVNRSARHNGSISNLVKNMKVFVDYCVREGVTNNGGQGLQCIMVMLSQIMDDHRNLSLVEADSIMASGILEEAMIALPMFTDEEAKNDIDNLIESIITKLRKLNDNKK